MIIAVKQRQSDDVKFIYRATFGHMDCKANIEKTALAKLNDAELLFNHGRFDTAYYIAGYAVELLLKAKICQTLGIDSFYDFDNPERKKLVKDESGIKKAYKVHRYDQLLALSGIFTEFDNEFSNDPKFLDTWSSVNKWNEGSRYLTGKTGNEVLNFITSVKEFCKWLQKHS